MQRLRERLAKRGLSEALIFGIGHCGGINPKTLAFFKDLSPGTGWHIAKHNRAAARNFPQQRYVEWMYIPDNLPVTPLSPRYLSDGKGLVSVMMQRLHDARQSPISMRTMAERAYLEGDSGPGRICLDYWPIAMSVAGRTQYVCLYDRFPQAIAAQRQPQLKELSVPGAMAR